MRRKLGVVLAVVVIALAVLWWRSRGTDDGARSAAQGSAAVAGKTTEAAKARTPKERTKLAPAKLAGRVTDRATGAGLAGAIVSVSAGELLPKFLRAQEQPTLIAVTDADGRWQVERVPPGAYRVAATAKGFLPGEHPKLTLGAGEDKRGLDLALAAGGTSISGTVSDVGGGPVADARVTASRSGIRELQADVELVALTGPDGTYELTLPSGSLKLTATHDEYASAVHRIDVAKEPMTVDFSLVPGATIRGQVVARDTGKPVRGGLVSADVSGASGGGRDWDGIATADEEGNFVLRGLSSGEVELSALGQGYATQSPTVVSIGIGEQLDGVKVLVDRAYSISGRVVRKRAPAEGLPGVTLGAFSIASEAIGLSLEPSADDGAYEIVGLKRGSYNLFAFGEGSVPEIGKPVEIVDRDVEDVIVELDAGVTISGRVEPATADVGISIAPTGPIGLANMFDVAKSIVVQADTDAAGAFVLRNVPAGAFTLQAHAEDGRTGEHPLLVAQVDQAGLVVTLEPRASISGRVVDTNHKPVADVRVHASRQGGEQKVSFSLNDRQEGVRSKADGTFTLVGLDAGEHLVSARDGGAWWEGEDAKPGKTKSASAEVVTLAAGATRTGVVLTVEARDGVIRGVVLAPDGKPAPDAWVTAHRATETPAGVPDRFARYVADSSKPVLTNADGQFTITRLRKGTFDVEVEGPKGASRATKAGVKPGDSVTIKLASLGTLTGKVTVAGAPVTKYTIECAGPKEAKQHVEAADGAYTLERIAPGAYECEVEGDAGTNKAKVEVGPEPKQLDISLIRWATVTGVAVDVLSKKPVPGLIVMAGTDGQGNASAFTNILAGRAPTTDPAGRFTVERVGVGTGQVALMPKDGFMPLGTRAYTATEGQRVDVGTIEVVPPRTGDAGTFGFSTSADDDKLVVASVAPDGPAKAAGLLEGDRIMSIDGREVAALSPGIAMLLLSSGTVGVGQSVVLSLDRAGTPVQVSLTSVKW